MQSERQNFTSLRRSYHSLFFVKPTVSRRHLLGAPRRQKNRFDKGCRWSRTKQVPSTSEYNRDNVLLHRNVELLGGRTLN